MEAEKSIRNVVEWNNLLNRGDKYIARKVAKTQRKRKVKITIVEYKLTAEYAEVAEKQMI